ncbi:MAG: dihydrodipicolinate synthase family protein [Anaerolineae bacterium]|nr:dihydrodipicolinate synthase family protein [Anaerolineae bacterium]
MSNPFKSPRYPRVILAAVCIPWDARGEVLPDPFREQIRLHLRAGIRHLYVFGTAGEGYAVTERQFDQIVDLFHAEMKGPDAHPMIGLISLSTRAIIERIERCLERGLSTFQFALPGWGALNDSELATFFAEVLGRFPQAQFVHYNLQRAGRVLTPAEYARLAAAHPNLVAAKNGTSAIVMLRDLLVQAPMLRHFYTELGFPQGCQVGEPGYLMSLTTMNPALALRFFEAGLRGDLATLFGIQAEALELFELLVGSGGAEIGATFQGAKAHMDGAYEKALARVLDPNMPLRLLPPYQSVSEAAYRQFVGRVRERLPGWMPDAAP